MASHPTQWLKLTVPAEAPGGFVATFRVELLMQP